MVLVLQVMLAVVVVLVATRGMLLSRGVVLVDLTGVLRRAPMILGAGVLKVSLVRERAVGHEVGVGMLKASGNLVWLIP